MWFLGGLLTGLISPGKTFTEPVIAAFFVAMPTVFYLVRSETVRTLPTFMYIIMATIGVLFTLIGSYIGERIQMGPPPKKVEWSVTRGTARAARAARIGRRGFLASSAVLVSGVWTGVARADAVDDVLREVGAARAKVRTLIAPFRQERVLSLLATSVTSKGELTLVRPRPAPLGSLPPTRRRTGSARRGSPTGRRTARARSRPRRPARSARSSRICSSCSAAI